MMNIWYEDGFEIKHHDGEKTKIDPRTIIFVPIKTNLQATIESASGISLFDSLPLPFLDRTPPSLFWKENLVSEENNKYVFKTRFTSHLEEVLSLDHVEKIPKRLKNEFLETVPEEFNDIAKRIIGQEKRTMKILKSLCVFVSEHEKPQTTSGKPLKDLLAEYESTGYFYGNCKEATDFYAALCNSIGFPTKKVIGKSYTEGGHAWVDVVVPVENGYKLVSADAALDFFNTHHPNHHMFFERIPDISTAKRFLNFFREKENSYTISIKNIA